MINTVAKAQILFSKDWKPGWYYDIDGKKVNGLLHWDAPSVGLFKGRGDHILFKTDKDGSRIKISSDSIKSFVIASDTFVISRAAAFEKNPVLHVMANKQTIKLYFSSVTSQSVSPGGFGAGGTIHAGTSYKTTSTSYYYGPDPEHLTELTRKTFIDVMSSIMADKPEVVNSIKSKYFKFGTINDLITYYNTGQKMVYNQDDGY